LNNEEKKKDKTNLDNSHLFSECCGLFSQYKYREDKSTITHHLSLSKVRGGEIDIKISTMYNIFSPQRCNSFFSCQVTDSSKKIIRKSNSFIYKMISVLYEGLGIEIIK